MVTKRKLNWRKGGTNYSAHLYTTRLGDFQYLEVRADGKTLYCPAYIASSDSVTFRKGGANYSVFDTVPQATVNFHVKYVYNPYGSTYTIDVLNINMGVTGRTINQKIEVQCVYGTIQGTWRTFLTLSADGYSTSYSGTIGSNYDYGFRLKIGSWYSSKYTSSANIIIPESAWGV